MALKFYTIVAKGVKLKVRRFLKANSYFSRGKLQGKTDRRTFLAPPILNRVN